MKMGDPDLSACNELGSLLSKNTRDGANGLPTVVTAFLEISAAIPEVAPELWSPSCLTALLTPEEGNKTERSR